MSVTIRGEAPRNRDYPTNLDDIFRLREPHQTYALMAFVRDEDPYALDDSNRVLVRMADRSQLTIYTRTGTKVYIGPKGRLVPRSLAVELMRLIGKNGQYAGKCMVSGIRKIDFDRADDSVRREMGWFPGMKMHFVTSYLEHVEDEVEENENDDLYLPDENETNEE